MDILYLKEFVTLAEVENYLDAADQLYISQSSLSKHIQSMEKELGFPLFNRTTRNVKLNDYGQVFVEYAKSVIASYDEGVKKINSMINKNQHIISIGVIPSIDSYGITDILSEFSTNKKGYKIQPYEEDSSKLVEALKSNTCSLAFIYDSNELDDQFIRIPYEEDTLVAVVPKSNPISKSSKISLKILSKQKCVLLESHSMLRKTAIEAFRKIGVEPSFSFTQRRFLSAFDLHDNKSIALFFKKDATYVNNPGNVIVDIIPKTKVSLCLCYLKTASLSEADIDFINLVKSKRKVKD